MGQAICRSESLGGCSKPSRILRPFVNSFLREGYQKPTLGGFCSHCTPWTSTKTIPQTASVHTPKNGDFGAIRSCTARISKVERNISDRFCATFCCSVIDIRAVAEVNK